MSNFPIRCFTCGKVVSHYKEKYEELCTAQHPLGADSQKNILNKLGIKRYCCRIIFLSYVNYQEKLLYNHNFLKIKE